MGTLLDLARTGCPALRAARFYVDFRAYISIASLYQKTPVNSDSRILRNCLFQIERARAPLKTQIKSAD
ncbi:hypothetical protein AB3X94_18495 [Paraburkholderia sp. BR10923]|uniref:hypothetical protein n=1 Tax=Paraburkholderia sp. BR10923 TaxID=3236992 RepID=UPI0034CD7798